MTESGRERQVPRIDKDSPLPYYYQVREVLRDKILSGTWPAGAQLPTEAEICRMFEVSRTTVRQAMAELLNEGLIRKEKGRGTFVAEPKIRERLVERLTGFYEDMVAQGLHPETRVLDQSVIGAPRAIATWLEIEPGAPVLRLHRLRLVHGEPFLLVVSYIPEALCPGLVGYDFGTRSLYWTLEHDYGLKLARGRRFIEAVAASDQEAQLLGVARGAPLLYLRSVTYLADGRPLEYYEAKHRGDRSRFEVELIRVSPNDSPNGEGTSWSAPPRAWGVPLQGDNRTTGH